MNKEEHYIYLTKKSNKKIKEYSILPKKMFGLKEIKK